MIGAEVDFVVADSLKALAMYEDIFPVERIEVTNLDKGQNEAVFAIYGARFHMLDENPLYQLVAPQPGQLQCVWFNVLVPNIAETWQKAINAGCASMQPVTDMAEFGVATAMFADPFGYTWMLHEVKREVSFEERLKLMEQQMQ